jgi:hypothetical protein
VASSDFSNRRRAYIPCLVETPLVGFAACAKLFNKSFYKTNLNYQRALWIIKIF